jgi:acetyl esterase/lipase
MSFEDLPPLPPLIHEAAKGYAERISAASRRVQREERCVLDVPYGSDYWQKVDIYLPRRDALQGLPVLLFLHGGAWRNGCKEWMGFMAPAILSLPAIFVSVSYRLAPATRFPGPAEDCADALAWIYNNIARYGGDRGRLFYGGHSAGGHLAALVTLDARLKRSRGLPPDVVKACFPVSGLYDLRSGIEGEVARAQVGEFLEDDGQIQPSSPLFHVGGNRTPFYMTYGSRDLPELIPQAKAMARALASEPGELRVQEFADYDHFDTSERCDREDHPWVSTVREWMTR